MTEDTSRLQQVKIIMFQSNTRHRAPEKKVENIYIMQEQQEGGI